MTSYQKEYLRRLLICFGIYLCVQFAIWYIFSPPINVKSIEFWLCFILPLSGFIICTISDINSNYGQAVLIILFALLCFFAFHVVRSWVRNSSPNETRAQIVKIQEDGSISDVVPMISSTSEFPIVDGEKAVSLGNQLIRSNPKYSHLQDKNPEFDLISYKGNYYQIAPLECTYKMSEGLTAYILINIYTGESVLVELKENEYIRYSPQGYLEDDLIRHIHSKKPNRILGKEHFELDENGNPFYIVPTLKVNDFLFGAESIETVLTVDAVTGKIKEYSLSDIPSWIDNVYDVKQIITEIEWNFDYKYPYGRETPITKYAHSNQYFKFAKDGHIYVYTGVTTWNADEKNIAFIISDLRTGESTYHSDYGIGEQWAKELALSSLPENQYEASQVMLVNIEGNSTYYLTLKNLMGQVEYYALINKANDVLVVEDSLEDMLRIYYHKISTQYPGAMEYDESLEDIPTRDEVNNEIPESTEPTSTEDVNEDSSEEKTITSTVSKIYTGTLDGNTVFLFNFVGNDEFFSSSLGNNVEQLARLVIGAKVTITYKVIEGSNVVTSIKFE